jgi:DNA-binding transcriptional ArsR family regulator
MRRPTPVKDISDPRWVRAISHPLRIRILAMLEDEAASPKVLAGQLEQPLGTIAYHVRTLVSLGLLELVETRPRRGAMEHYYRARQHPRFTDAAWDGLDIVAKQRVLGSVLGEAHEQAMRAAAGGGFDASDAHFTRTPLQLDAEGWTKLAQATKRWLREAGEIESESRDRIERGDSEAIDVGLVILLFEAVAGRLTADHAGEDGAKPRRAAVRSERR